MQRRLAAILVADIVGYSAQMDADETGTHARVTTRRREVFEPEIARHGGRIFKTTGDGFLAEFGSAVQAVECAVAVQEALAARNLAVPADRAIRARIGINLGEVIVDGDDLFGDGVNVAARLEPLAEPGGICVSDKVAREVEKKLAFGFESMGERRVKNIAEPIHVYRVSSDVSKGPRIRSLPVRVRWRTWATAIAAGLAVCLAAAAYLMQHKPVARAGPPLVAVMPFSNMSGDPGQDYLGYGIADDIITMLSTSPTLRVVSKSSSFAFAGADLTGDIAAKLKVDYFVEGSVRKTPASFRLSTQLVRAADGENLWAARFEQEGGDIAALQEAVAQKVYATLGGTRGEVARSEVVRSWDRSGPSMEEYDYHLRGMARFLTYTLEGKGYARRIWEEGLAKFPDSGLLRLELAAWHYNAADEGHSSDPWQDLQTAWRLIGEADARPERSRMEEWLSHYLKSLVIPLVTGDFEWAVREAEAAHAIVPFDPMSSVDLSFVMASAGRADTAVEWAEYAVGTEALVPDWYRDRLAWAYYTAGRAEDAVREYDKIDFLCLPCKAAALAHAGRTDDAKAAVDMLRAVNPGMTLERAGLAPGGRFPYMAPGPLAGYLRDLAAAGLE